MKAITPDEAEALADRFYRALPSARITGVLAEVDRWTGFSSAFTHLHTGLPADNSRVVLTAVLADATNLGLTRMADACSVASHRQLAWTAGWHLREDTYRNALALLVNAQHSQPLAAVFGAADVSSSDGQGFPTSGRGEAVGATNAHYGRDVTAMFYTHVSGRHAPYNTVAIPPSGEAAYVIDGLLYHEADMTIATHHTDGGGVSDHVFGLAHLLGFRFAPRIPNLAERRLYAFEPATRWPALAPFIAGRPDDKLIAAHWDDVLRLTASVRTGVVSASLMLKRLAVILARTGWRWPCARSAVSSARSTPWTGWSNPSSGDKQPRNSTRASPETHWPAPSVSIASADCATVPSRRSSTVRAGSPWSRPRSRCGTPSISAARSTPCVAVAKPCRTLCLPTSRRSAGSTSISPATIYGRPTACQRRRSSGSCANCPSRRPKPPPHDRVPGLFREPCYSARSMA